MIVAQQPTITYKFPTFLTTGTKLAYTGQIHWKQIMGTPTSKSGKPLIAEDAYELTVCFSPKVNRFLLISPSPVIGIKFTGNK